MYLEHFGLAEKPFSTSPDPRFFYLSPQHREAIAKAEYAVTEKLGLTVIHGDVGTGKTTVARMLLQKFKDDDRLNAVLLTNPAYPTENQLLRAICQEFRIKRSAKAKLDLLNIFQGYLIEQWQQGIIPAIIVDEAHTMKPPLLELVRQLLNFETNTEKLIQVVLFGETDLRRRLDRKRNLKSRVAMYGALTTLSPSDARAMLAFRYTVADGGNLPFADPALDAVYRYSRGIARAACIICDNALLKTFLRGQHIVTKEIVDEVQREHGEPDPKGEEQKVGRSLRSVKEAPVHG